jgi:tight adherence protein B
VNLTLIVLLCFLAIVLVAVAVVMLLRDLVFAGKGPKTTSLLERSRMLRKSAKASEAVPRSVIDKMDRGFDRLILESGVDFSSLTAGLICIAFGLVIGGALWLSFNRPEIGLLMAAFGMGCPLIWLMFKRRKRMIALREEIPQLLDLLARSARAGRSLEQSLKLASEEMSGTLGTELDLCVKQLEVGRSFSAVMKSLTNRIRLLEVRILASTLTVQRQSGGNLPETLDRMARVVRDRLFANKKMRATTSAGRASAMLIAAICPIAYLTMFILQPEHMSVLLNDSLGQMLLMVAVTLELVGMFWVANLLKEEE